MNDFYEKNHRTYFDTTVNIDPSGFLAPLAKRLQPGATILDIGCGSGRDLLWLTEQGFQPTGFEQSTSLAALVREHSGREVIIGDFMTFDFSTLNFDALVLIGSIVHLSRSSVAQVLTSITRALVPGGLLLVTMKEGQGISRIKDGREFMLWNEDDLVAVFSRADLHVLDKSRMISKVRTSDTWLGFVLKFCPNDNRIQCEDGSNVR